MKFRVFSIGSAALRSQLTVPGSLEVHHEVHIAGAQRYLSDHKNEFDVVVIGYPGETRLAKRIGEVRPEVPVLPVAADDSRHPEEEMVCYHDLPNTAGLARLYKKGDVVEKIPHIMSLEKAVLAAFEGDKEAMEEAIAGSMEANDHHNRWYALDELLAVMT